MWSVTRALPRAHKNIYTHTGILLRYSFAYDSRWSWDSRQIYIDRCREWWAMEQLDIYIVRLKRISQVAFFAYSILGHIVIDEYFFLSFISFSAWKSNWLLFFSFFCSTRDRERWEQNKNKKHTENKEAVTSSERQRNYRIFAYCESCVSTHLPIIIALNSFSIEHMPITNNINNISL